MVHLKRYAIRKIEEEDILLDKIKPQKFVLYDGVNAGWLIYKHKDDDNTYRDFISYPLAKLIISKKLTKVLTGKFYEGYLNIMKQYKKGAMDEREAIRTIKSLLAKENPTDLLLITNPCEKEKKGGV